MAVTLKQVADVLEEYSYALNPFYRIHNCQRRGVYYRSEIQQLRGDAFPGRANFSLDARLVEPEFIDRSNPQTADLEFVSLSAGGLVPENFKMDLETLPAQIQRQQEMMDILENHFRRYYSKSKGYKPVTYPRYESRSDIDLQNYLENCKEGRLKFLQVEHDLRPENIPYILMRYSTNIKKSMIGATRGMFFVSESQAPKTWQQQIAAFHSYYAFMHGVMPQKEEVSRLAENIDAPTSWEKWVESKKWNMYLTQIQPFRKIRRRGVA